MIEVITNPMLLGSVFFFVILFIGMAVLANKFLVKVGPEESVVRSGMSGMQAVSGGAIWVLPIIHRAEKMDISVKRIEIMRRGEAGLICRDNIRADIEVAFFVRVNNTRDDIMQVAQSLGCKRASARESLVELFDAKFSEALKTVGKKFDFVELYNERDKFKLEILNTIGTDLNGYVLDDCAIDFLEQTPLELLKLDNILDAEGIKKITELTAKEHILSNGIAREKEKTIKKQDVEAVEAILELEKQRVEAEEKQKRECSAITSRETAEAKKVEEEERLKAERARIGTEEEIAVAEENKLRQVIVAAKNKERTEAVEQERVVKDRDLEATERERVVTLAQIDKEKAVEVEKKNIQDVIRERVMVERAVVEEQERIKDTEEFAGADRLKRVTVTKAEMTADEALVKEVKAADAAKQSASLLADKEIIEAEAHRAAAEKEMEATKLLAEGEIAEQAASGLADARVMEAKADATEKFGTSEANVVQKKAVAEAKGQEAKATALEKEGQAEANVMQAKYDAEAEGIQHKAEAMKIFDSVGKDHEEFKLRLNKEKDIEMAAISAQKDIADAQAEVVGQALKSARIDIVGGETTFFDKIVDSIKGGKSVDRFVHNSEVLTDVKNTFFNGNPEYFQQKLTHFVEQFNVGAEEVRDLSVAALIGRLLTLAGSDEDRGDLQRLLELAVSSGVAERKSGTLGIGRAAPAGGVN